MGFNKVSAARASPIETWHKTVYEVQTQFPLSSYLNLLLFRLFKIYIKRLFPPQIVILLLIPFMDLNLSLAQQGTNSTLSFAPSHAHDITWSKLMYSPGAAL